MPHQCTSCGRTFADGSKEMLSGCPDCGGNKFQFMPAGAVDGDPGGAGGHGTGAQSRGAGGTAAKKRPDDARSTDAPSGGAPETGAAPGRAPDDGGGGRSTDRRGTDDRGAVNRAAATVREWVSSRGDANDGARNEADDRVQKDDRTPKDARSRKHDRTRNPDEPADRATDEVDETPEDAAQASARRDVVSEDELPEDPPETARSGDDADGSPRTPDGPTSTPAETSTSSPAETPAPSASETSAPSASETPEASPTDAPASSADDGAEVVDAPDDRNPGLEELREELNSQFESIRIVNPGQYELNLMELYEREEYIISLQEDGKYVIEVPDAWDAVER